MGDLRLAGTTFAWVHYESLEVALKRLSDAGVDTFELMTVAPHVGDLHEPSERSRVRAVVQQAGLSVLSVNPTFVDINLVSSDPAFRRASVARMRSEIEFASELGAPLAVIMPGRRHLLSPAVHEQCLDWLRESLEPLIIEAERHDVVLCMENSPYGYMGRSQDILEVMAEYASPRLRVAYDVANALAVEDPNEGVDRLRDFIAVAHVSDCWKDHWAHTSPGRGEVDFSAFANALTQIGFDGFTVYELVDGEPVGDRMERDLTTLVNAGWTLNGV